MPTDDTRILDADDHAPDRRTLLDEIEEAQEQATPGGWYVDHKAPPHHGADCIVYIVERKRHGRIARMWSGRSKEFQNAALIALLRNNANPLLAVVRAAAEMQHEHLDTCDAVLVDYPCSCGRQRLVDTIQSLDPRLLGE